MRNYLLKAGMLLAPDVFLLAMDGEEALKVGQASIEKLADKVNQYKKAVSKISGHLNRLEDTDPIERLVTFCCTSASGMVSYSCTILIIHQVLVKQ